MGALAANPSSARFHLPTSLRLVSVRGGIVACSAKGRFLFRGDAASVLTEHVVPLLYEHGATEAELARRVPDWTEDTPSILGRAGVLSSGAGAARRTRHGARGISIPHPTPLALVVSDLLRNQGLIEESPSDLVFADFSDLDATAAHTLALGLHSAGSRCLAVWRGRNTDIIGPLTVPGQDACWNCARTRLDEPIPLETEAPPDHGVTDLVARTIRLALLFPELAARGCLVIDDGRESAVHAIVPAPWCAVCGGAAGPAMSRQSPLGGSPHVPAALHILADPRGGVLRRLTLYEAPACEAPAVPFCATASIGPWRDGRISVGALDGQGKGATPGEAAMSAIGEGLERYSASLWSEKDLVFASHTEVAKHAFDPRWLVLYDQAQYSRPNFPFAPFEASRPIAWTAGQWLDTGEEALLPAHAIYMNLPTPQAERFAQTTSNGLAAAQSFEDAARGAIHELIERDAFMLHWLAGIPGRRVDVAGCEPIVAEALGEVERFGAQIEIYLLDAGTGVATIACLGLGDGVQWPGTTIGLAADADPLRALRRAVLEHGHYGPYMRRLMREGRHADLKKGPDVNSALDHGLYYVDPRRATALDRLRHGEDLPISLAELYQSYFGVASLAADVQRLALAGIRIAVKDVTTPDIALAPVRVVRALGSWMQPIHFGYYNRRLRNPRLRRLLSGAARVTPHPLA